MPTTRNGRAIINTTWDWRPALTTVFYYLQDTEWNFIVDTEDNNIQVIWEPYNQDTVRQWRPAI